MTISTSPIATQSIGQITATGTGPQWITDPNLRDVYGDDELLIHLEASDPDNDTISYYLAPGSQPLPSGITLDGVTGVLYGITPDVQITRKYDFTIRAATVDGFADRPFSLVINPQLITWKPKNLGSFNEGQISELQIDVDNFDLIESGANFVASNLPSSLSITDNGHITGTFPYVNQNTKYWINIELFYENNLILGPERWSFTVKNVYQNIPSSVYTFLGLSLEEKYDWLVHLRTLTDNYPLYRPDDPNFSTIDKPYVPIFDGLKTFNTDTNTVNEYFDKINFDTQYRFPRIFLYIKDLEVYESDHYDVLYYSLMDYGSTTNKIKNVHEDPNYFYPNSLENLRDKLQSVGTENGEILEPWMGDSYKPGIPLAYLEKGFGQEAKEKFNETSDLRRFLGMKVIIDRIIFLKKDGSNWLNAGDSEYQFKLNSDTVGPDYRSTI